MAEIVIPWAAIALMYFTKYFAYDPKYYVLSVPPIDFPLSFIHVGGLQGVAIIFILGLIANMLFNMGTKLV